MQFSIDSMTKKTPLVQILHSIISLLLSYIIFKPKIRFWAPKQGAKVPAPWELAFPKHLFLDNPLFFSDSCSTRSGKRDFGLVDRQADAVAPRQPNSLAPESAVRVALIVSQKKIVQSQGEYRAKKRMQ